MKPIVDRRTELGNAPGVHALLVGVSQYAHLPGVDDPPSDACWGLTSLASPALSASLLADWLQTATDLARPLKTLRLLLAPSLLESLSMIQSVAIPNHANFAIDAWNWRTDCCDSKDSIALFYYAGHGFTRGRGDYNLLLTLNDLFDPGAPKLKNVTLAANLFNGMAPQTRTDTVARQQFFFFDCCRTYPSELASFDDRSVAPILNVKIVEGVGDDRVYMRCNPVPDNISAFASKGRATYFADRLLDALQYAGCPSSRGWKVDGDAIRSRLRVRYKQLTGLNLACDSVDSPVLRNLAQPPTVDIEIRLDPAARATGRRVGLQNGTNLIPGVEIQTGQHEVKVAPGQYELKVRPPSGGWSTTNDSQRHCHGNVGTRRCGG